MPRRGWIRRSGTATSPISRTSSKNPTITPNSAGWESERLDKARATLEYVKSAEYRESLVGMIGTDPALV